MQTLQLILLSIQQFFLQKTSLIFLTVFVTVTYCQLKEFDDSILFKMSWQKSTAMPAKYQGAEDISLDDSSVLISTGLDERYLCQVPSLSGNSRPKLEQYNGPSPGQLLAPLYASRSCTYRIEMFWTYELCHGRFLLQYHEEKEASGGKAVVRRTEYYLGQFMSDRVGRDDLRFDQLNPPTRQVDDQLLAYYPVRYTDGTVCDINGRPRSIEVQYVCVTDGKNQMYALDEVSSCEYRVVVLTNRLCSHPSFQPAAPKEHPINCFPMDEGSPVKPYNLVVWENEQKFQFQKEFVSRIVSSSITFPKEDSDDEQQEQDTDEEEKDEKQSVSPPPTTAKPYTVVKDALPTDQHLAASFLSGDYCLYGGAGWWKYEYCHGKQVLQFHEDPETGRSEVVLGVWDRDMHLAWIGQQSHKKPLRVDGKVRQVSHLYVRGDMCDETKAHRSVEVRLRCRETQGNRNAVTLYLLEPKVCEYIMSVESAMFCDLLQSVDERGLIS